MNTGDCLPNSRRTISIGAELTRILGQHFETWVPNFNVADITAATSPTVFTGPEGGPFRLTNFRRRHWKQAVSDSVGAPMRIHDLRHTAAALAIEQGAQPKVLSERLGHRDISTTYNTYGHLFPGYDETLADRVVSNPKIAESPLTTEEISEDVKALLAFRDEAPQSGLVTDFSLLTSVPGVNADIISALEQEAYLGAFTIREPVVASLDWLLSTPFTLGAVQIALVGGPRHV